ncbi:putative c2h2 finger domain [Diplodia seriata]|uniref:Putative c2h2 finger domain n=1 Tax=Diplodia seriata TaxID=420778 RepID=A0A0G2F0C3_9PEZI|nr:putative c2h2 finger domain [Diplodia seriata]
MSFRCPKPDCGATFESDKACRKHCVAEDDHDYCKKCDYLAKDWDDLTHHKATSPIVHLCCKFCGQDFKSSSGRDRHIKQLHPVDQDIRCIGCDEHFVRAAALIEHLEFDHCSKISAQQFKSNIQHKHMVNKILNDPDAVTSKLFDFNVNDTDTSGGITLSKAASLLDEERGGSVIKPLKPRSHEWDAALKAREMEYESANSTNMLMQRYWDPTHKDYNPERFFNPVIEMYSCPFPQCDDNFTEPYMLEFHINTEHGISQQRCPQCLKLFKSTTALVAHCEAPTSECGISRSDRFGQAIDQFSGGFLGAKDARRPDFTLADREDRFVDKKREAKEPGSGYKVGMIKYESTLPLDWPRESFRPNSNTQIGRSWDEGGRGPNVRGNMNPAVPLSKSRKVHHSTANIYPQPFQDYVPEVTEKLFAPRRERRAGQPQPSDTASTILSKENDAPASSGRKKSKRRENMAAQLIDTELYRKRYSSDTIVSKPEEPMAPMRRVDAYYMSGEQPDGDDGDDGVSISASSTTHRSAWE